MQYSGQSNLKRVSLELGGKSPQIIFADCPDLNAAAFHAAWGIFFNQGEVCTAASRLLVHESIADAFIDKLLMIAKRITPGDPFEPTTMAQPATAQLCGLAASAHASRVVASLSSRPCSTK
jgi:gamma-glutamyl-gamma-aminobutyraldehyde dehydrogenase